MDGRREELNYAICSEAVFGLNPSGEVALRFLLITDSGSRFPVTMGWEETTKLFREGGIISLSQMEGRALHVGWEYGRPYVIGWL